MKKLILVTSLLVSNISYANLMCVDYFKSQQIQTRTYWYDRFGKSAEFSIDLKNPMSILAEQKQAQSAGIMLSRFDHRYETRMYFAGTGAIEKNGEIPYVDPNSKAVFIFIHGSGTMASSGKNFNGIMNQLAALNFSALSFDMPFHAEGPIRDQFKDANYFMNWLDKIVSEAKLSGKPIYLVGHSFGPDVIAEYITRNPFKVDGAVALSPAGFTKELSDWYDNYTSKMNFGGDTFENRLAGQWAGQMSQQFRWNKTNGSEDPTLKNPNLKLRMMSGNREEYVEAPVGGSKKTPIGDNTYDIAKAFKVFFKNSITTIEPGVGHYIFSHQDKNGVNIVLREVLAVVDLDAKDVANLRKQAKDEKVKILSATIRASQLYGSDRVFKAWIDSSIGFKSFYSLIQKENHHVLNDYVVNYEDFKIDFDRKVNALILKSDFTLPGFYKMNQEVIDAAKKSTKNSPSLQITLFDYLKTEKPEVVEKFFANLQ